MSRVISQEAFNAVVRENMEEFEMTEDEAISEAVDQFQAQGVNISTIMKNTSDSEAIISETKKLKELTFDVGVNNECFMLLNHLESLVKLSIAAKLLAAKEGLYAVLIEMLLKSDNDNLQIKVVETLCALMDGYPDLLDSKGILLILKSLDEGKSEELIICYLKWLVLCVSKHEPTRAALIRGGIAGKLRDLIHRCSANHKLVSAVCDVTQILILDDDVRVVHGDAHEHARSLAKELLPLLISILPEFTTDAEITYNLLHALTSLLVRNEFCILFHEQGGLKFVMDAMVDHTDDEKVNRGCLSILKALAGSDEVKGPIIASGAAPLVISAINKHYMSSSLALIGCTCIAALSLRSPVNSKALSEAGGPEVLVRLMTHWKKNKVITKQGCAAIRNQVSRCPELRSEYAELQLEELLREIKDLHGDLDFEAKKILVDLGCDVHLKEEWKGEGVQLSND